MMPLSRLALASASVAITRPLFVFALLLAVSLAAYSPVLNGAPLWDDIYLVGGNPFFRSPIFALETFRHFLFVDSPSAYYRPVQNLSYMLDYLVWNGTPIGYHLSNILIHCTAGFLLCLLLQQLLRVILSPRRGSGTLAVSVQWTNAAAFLVALVWTVHPIHSAGVAYISGRADSLATLFVAAAWLSFLRAGKTPRALVAALWGGAACALYLLALCSKEIAGIWLPLFALFTLFFDKERPSRQRVLGVIGGVAVIGCYLMLRSIPIASGAMPDSSPTSIPIRCLLALRALGDYASLILFPANLRMDRMLLLPPQALARLSDFAVLRYELLSAIGVATIIGVALACASRRPGRKLRLFGAAWFIIGFLPISNLFPLNAQSAEHWIYMASIGALVFLAGCALMLPARLQAWAPAAVLLAACGFGARTGIRSADWTEPARFFSRTVEAGGDSVRIKLNHALSYANQGDTATTEKLLRELVAQYPTFAHARISLGINLYSQKRFDEAEPYLNHSAADAVRMKKQNPYYWTSSLHLAWMRMAQGRKEEAMGVIDAAISESPSQWKLVEAKARFVEAAHGTDAAVKLVRKYTAARWWHYDAAMFLAQLLHRKGEHDPAVKVLQRAAKLDIHKGEAFEKIAEIEEARGRFAEACAAQRKAVKREPDLPSRHFALASLLKGAGHEAEAVETLKLANTLRTSARAQSAPRPDAPMAGMAPLGI